VSREETLWYYDELAKTFESLTDSPMVAELRTVVDELAALSRSGSEQSAHSGRRVG
jgi:hypothetical protein